jgi:hypothetical protein
MQVSGGIWGLSSISEAAGGAISGRAQVMSVAIRRVGEVEITFSSCHSSCRILPLRDTDVSIRTNREIGKRGAGETGHHECLFWEGIFVKGS